MIKFKPFSEFKKDYEEKGFIDKVSTRYYPLKKINPAQLWSYYLQYLKKLDKKYNRDIRKGNIYDTFMNSPGDFRTPQKWMPSSKDSELSAFVRERDDGCRLLKVLTADEFAEWSKNQNGVGGILDVAHVFGKGAFPWMRYDEKNVVTLNRYSHFCLDNGKSPIDGKMITDDEHKIWWRRIVGDDDYEYLKSKSLRQEGN